MSRTRRQAFLQASSDRSGTDSLSPRPPVMLAYPDGGARASFETACKAASKAIVTPALPRLRMKKCTCMRLHWPLAFSKVTRVEL
jgi:hypothetical protein